MEVWLKVTLSASDDDGDEVDLDSMWQSVADDLVYEVERLGDSLAEVNTGPCSCDQCDGHEVQPEISDVTAYSHAELRERYRPVPIIH